MYCSGVFVGRNPHYVGRWSVVSQQICSLQFYYRAYWKRATWVSDANPAWWIQGHVMWGGERYTRQESEREETYRLSGYIPSVPTTYWGSACVRSSEGAARLQKNTWLTDLSDTLLLLKSLVFLTSEGGEIFIWKGNETSEGPQQGDRLLTGIGWRWWRRFPNVQTAPPTAIKVGRMAKSSVQQREGIQLWKGGDDSWRNHGA